MRSQIESRHRRCQTVGPGAETECGSQTRLPWGLEPMIVTCLLSLFPPGEPGGLGPPTEYSGSQDV